MINQDWSTSPKKKKKEPNQGIEVEFMLAKSLFTLNHILV